MHTTLFCVIKSVSQIFSNFYIDISHQGLLLNILIKRSTFNQRSFDCNLIVGNMKARVNIALFYHKKELAEWYLSEITNFEHS